MLLKSAHWYRSKAALEWLKRLRLVDPPYTTPDGFAVMVFNAGGKSLQPSADGKPPVTVEASPHLAPQGDNGHDLLHVDTSGHPKIARVEIPIDALPDLEPLVEYDHLPEGRKDYTVYPKGHKLA